MATKWGILSVGKICNDFVTVLRSLPKKEHEIVAAAARDLDRAQKFTSLHQIPKAYGSYEELANDKDVEIVYIGTIAVHHFEVGKLMLENGKHVLLEKPMCMNLRQTEELIAIAKKNNRFLMEALWSRFFPAYKKLAEEIALKTIGDVVYVNVTFGFEVVNRFDESERHFRKALPDQYKVIPDLGVYTANALLFVFGEEPKQIKAVGQLNEDGAEEYFSSAVLFNKNKTANVAASMIVNLPNELEVVGTKGKIKVCTPFHAPTDIITPEKTYHYPLPDTVLPCHFPNSSGLRYEAMAVRECLKKGLTECPEMTHNDSLMNARIRDQWRKELGVVYAEDHQ